MSVDNKAMTIKDLSEMAMTMGYSCLNVSAASQAITTYIRAHLQRCEAQQDQPLLLKHILSGTPADDDLFPALYSTCGGASMSTQSRLTNFRRGTVVWYLSRVTGASCPFSRAGIRLCDYVDLGAPQPISKKRKEFEQCGQKRKRRSSRECVLKHSLLEPSRRSPSPLSSIPDPDEFDESSDSEQPPPVKVKLTLKLPPLARVRQEAAAAAVLCRRSPSVPYSVASAASPPPDSEEEDSEESSDEDDSEREVDLSMDVDVEADVQDRFPEDFEDEAQFSDGWDDDDDDEELSTTWESPGPRSPSAQPPPAFKVKEEPRDVQELLDQWEYDLDTIVKAEEPPYPTWEWEWDSSYHHGPFSSPSDNSTASVSSPIQPRIKQEDDFDLSLSLSGSSFTDWRQSSSALSPTTPFGFTFGDESDMFPMSPGAFPVSPTSPTMDYPAIRPRSRTVPSLSLGGFLPEQFLETPSRPSDPLITNSLSSLVHSLSMDSPHALFGSSLFFRRPSTFSESEEDEALSEPRTEKELPPPCVSPNDIRIEHDGLSEPGPIVVNTCEPCVPQIFATHIAGMFDLPFSF
jgi:hypothetical protein